MKFKTEMVLNRQYGGFSLSKRAATILVDLHGWKLSQTERGSKILLLSESSTQHCYLSHEDDRFHPDLIALVKRIGDEANGPSASLRVEEVWVEFSVTDNDGKESVHISGHLP